MHRARLICLALAGPLLTAACSDAADPTPRSPVRPTLDRATRGIARAPGEPVPGLTARQRTMFERGRELFEREFEPETGLGPLFNEASCGECHEDPVLGGGGDEVEVHVAMYGETGSCDNLSAFGGPVIQQHATPAMLAALAPYGYDHEPSPAGAPVALRISPPIFGRGLLDAVPDEAILALADPDDRDGDGISGRPHLSSDGRVGRFGRKALTPSLRGFNDEAFLNEMGVTSPSFPAEGRVGDTPVAPDIDGVADPEIDADTLAATDAFVRFLAPPAPLVLTKEARLGEDLFAESGCAACHVPVLRTSRLAEHALRNKSVAAYTDLLLHDMGPELADICLGGALPTEFRTEPLMGLRFQSRFMHDGRAATVEAAIEAHGGEASAARERFRGLSGRERSAIVAFLQSL